MDVNDIFFLNRDIQLVGKVKLQNKVIVCEVLDFPAGDVGLVVLVFFWGVANVRDICKNLI